VGEGIWSGAEPAPSGRTALAAQGVLATQVISTHLNYGDSSRSFSTRGVICLELPDAGNDTCTALIALYMWACPPCQRRPFGLSIASRFWPWRPAAH